MRAVSPNIHRFFSVSDRQKRCVGHVEHVEQVCHLASTEIKKEHKFLLSSAKKKASASIKKQLTLLIYATVCTEAEK